jgi:hypothetical protein
MDFKPLQIVMIPSNKSGRTHYCPVKLRKCAFKAVSALFAAVLFFDRFQVEDTLFPSECQCGRHYYRIYHILTGQQWVELNIPFSYFRLLASGFFLFFLSPFPVILSCYA